MDKDLAKIIRMEVEQACEPIAEKHGLEFGSLTGSYSDIDFKMRISFKGKDSQGRNSFQVNWHNYAEMCGMKKEWLGMKVNGKTIIGFNPRKSKYSVLLSGGFQTTVASVIRALEK